MSMCTEKMTDEESRCGRARSDEEICYQLRGKFGKSSDEDVDDMVPGTRWVKLTSRWVVLARGEFSRDEFSTSDDDHGVFGQLHFMNVLVVHFSTGLWFARVRAASRCVLERLSWHHREGV